MPATSTSISSGGVDMVLDGGNCGLVPTSVIDLSGGGAEVVRVGRGDVTAFGASGARIMSRYAGASARIFL